MVYPHLFRTEHSETKTTNGIYGEFYTKSASKKVLIQPNLLKILQYVDSNRQKFLEDLEKLVSIQSISSNLHNREGLTIGIKAIEEWLIKLGMKYEVFNIGWTMRNDKKVRLPPVILASIGKDLGKKTIVVYAHIDVKDPDRTKWYTEPFKLTKSDKAFYGNGVASGKGPLLCWLHVIEAFQASGVEFPVNLKFIIESMFHENSEGLAEFLATRKQDFFCHIDNIVVCESEWLGFKRPCVVYGTVGVLHCQITVTKTENSSSEPKQDLEKIFHDLCDEEEHVLIPDFYKLVQQITPDEEKIYEAITDFDVEEIRPALPPFKQSWQKQTVLMSFWRLPSIWLGPIEECTCPEQDTTIAKGHFIIKIVPRQYIENTVALTQSYLQSLIKNYNIENKVDFDVLSSTRTWYEDINHPYYEAARRATMQIYKVEPNLIREDCARTIVTILDQILEKTIVFLPICNKNSNADKENERIAERNFFEGTKLCAAYLFQVAQK